MDAISRHGELSVSKSHHVLPSWSLAHPSRTSRRRPSSTIRVIALGATPKIDLADSAASLEVGAYADFNGFYVAGHKPGQIAEAACWAHGRRKLFELADLQKAPIAIETVPPIMPCSP